MGWVSLNSSSQGWKIFSQNGLSYAGSRYLISFFYSWTGFIFYAGPNDLKPPYVRPRNLFFFFFNTLSRGTATYKLSFPRHVKRRKVKKLKKKVSKLLVWRGFVRRKSIAIHSASIPWFHKH